MRRCEKDCIDVIHEVVYVVVAVLESDVVIIYVDFIICPIYAMSCQAQT
jgi:hypothetical protein